MKNSSLRNRGSLLSALVLFVSACSTDTPIPSQPTLQRVLPEAARAEIQAAVEGRQTRGFEDELLRLESRIPGLGGMFKAQDGSVVAFLTDQGNQGLARAELARNLALFENDASVKRDVQNGKIQFRQGRHSFSELVAWQQQVAARVARMKGVVSIDADESTNRVEVGIEPGTSQQPFLAALAPFNLPADAVSFRYDSPVLPVNIRGRFPLGLAGGMQIGTPINAQYYALCSIGIIATLYGETGFVTAAHCNAPGSMGDGSTGSPVHQNAPPNNIVGTVYLNPAWNRTDAACGGNPLCAWTDAMFVRSNGYRTFNKQMAHTQSAGTNSAYGSIFERSDWWQVIGRTSPMIGATIDKVARTTGWTVGTLDRTCNTLPNYDGAVVLCLNRVANSAVGPGDSGGSVFTRIADGNLNIYAAGILTARDSTTVYNHLNEGGETWCDVNCKYWYADYTAIETHLGAYGNLIAW